MARSGGEVDKEKYKRKKREAKRKVGDAKKKKPLGVNGAKTSEGTNKLFRVASQMKEKKDMQWSSFIKDENILVEQNEVDER